MPWSSGPRFCPGTEMSQVEFVAVITTVFREWKVEAAQQVGHLQADARRRLSVVVADTLPKLGMQMVIPGESGVEMVKALIMSLMLQNIQNINMTDCNKKHQTIKHYSIYL